MPQKKTDDEFIYEMKQKNPKVKILEPYVNSTTKLNCECKICGNVWKAAPNHLLQGKGCPACSIKKSSNDRRYSTEQYSEKMKKINPNINIIGEYVNSKTKILVRCSVCDNTWEATPSSLLSGTGCPKCSKRYRRNTKEFKDELKSINPYISVIGEYVNAHKKIKVRCDRCGLEWDVEPNSLLKGNDCPVCGHSQTSIVEKIFYNSFVLLLGEGKVLSRDKTAIGKELDIYIPCLKLAIEYGAWYWHSSKIDMDAKKESLCEKAGIYLLTIYEGCPQDSSSKEFKNSICYKNVISNEKDFKTVQNLIFGLCDKYELDRRIIESRWKRIVKTSRESSRKKDAEEFASELSEANPTIKYISGYSGAKTPVFVQCIKCGNKWNSSSAYDLLHGHGCPECAKINRSFSQMMSHDGFAQQVNKVNPHIKLLGNYLGSNHEILCQCNICGNKWDARPESIRYKKINCPKCSKVTKKTNDAFLSELRSLTDKIIPIDEYVNGRTKIRFKCLVCQYEWNAKPSDILKGGGCPKCAHRVPINQNEFIERVKKSNDSIEIIGKYVNSKTNIKCRCRKCGHEWYGAPSNLLHGAGCQRCAGTIRLSNDEFLRRLHECNANILPLEEYKNLSTKLLCRCIICGYEWRAYPNNLVNGHGCPKCKGDKARINRSKRIICIETNRVYDSILLAKKETGITSISDCLNHRTKTAGGYHWKYLD